MAAKEFLATVSRRFLSSDYFPEEELPPEGATVDWFMSWSSILGEFFVEPNRRAFEQRFMRLESNSQRVAFLLDDPRVLPAVEGLVRIIISEGKMRSKAKSLEKASKARREGNEFFKRKDMTRAIEKYNEAISWAPNDPSSEELSLCFGNRSAAFFRLNRFNDALLDIEDALNRNYPKERTSMLFIRKLNCLKSIGVDVEAERFAEQTKAWTESQVQDETLKHQLMKQIDAEVEVKGKQQYPDVMLSPKDVNKKLIGAKSCLKMGYDREKGRTIEATREIDEGEVLVIEKPLVSWLDPTYYSEYCYHCLRPLEGMMVPCRECVLIRFCSKGCCTESWDQYHRIECHYLDALQHLCSGHSSLKMGLIFGVQEVIESQKCPEAAANEWPGKIFSHNLESLSSLCTRNDQKCFEHLYALSFGSAILAKFLQVIGVVDREQVPVLGGFIMRGIQQQKANGFVIYDDGLKCSQYEGLLVANEGKKIGQGLYGTLSLFSHRCFSTTRRSFLGSKLILTATRSIKPGEEVTVLYWGQSLDKSFVDRQRGLKSLLGFTCRCTACMNQEERPSYKCPKCEGNLVINDDESNFCVNCGVKNQSVAQLKSYYSADCLEAGVDLIEKGLYDEAEVKLLRCEELLSRSLQKYNYKHLEVKEPLSRCFESKGMFNEAIKYRLDCVFYQKLVSGENSFDTLYHFIKLIELFVKKSAEKDKTKCLSNATFYFEKCVQIYVNIMTMEFKTISEEQLDLVPTLHSLGQLDPSFTLESRLKGISLSM